MHNSYRLRPGFALLLVAAVAGCGNTPDAPQPDLGSRDQASPHDLVSLSDQADGATTPTKGPKITMCPAAGAAPLQGATCAVTAGDARQLLTGTVLTPGEVLRGGQVLVDDKGTITCVACDCSA